jgi:hypothetical protein
MSKSGHQNYPHSETLNQLDMKKHLLALIFLVMTSAWSLADNTFVSGTNQPPDSPESQPSQYTVTASVNQANSGYTSGGGAFFAGSQVTLDATANPGWVFVNWTEYGSQVSTDASCELSVEANRNLTANFVKQFSINVSSNPANGGYTAGANTYPSGEMITLKAYPNSGWVFSKWTENGKTVSTSESYSTYVDANRNLVANFISTVGLPIYQVPSFKIYPNPTEGQLTIENSAPGQASISEISLIDASGVSVFKKNDNFSDMMVIDISGSKPGRYNLRIMLTDGKFTNYKIMLTD